MAIKDGLKIIWVLVKLCPDGREVLFSPLGRPCFMQSSVFSCGLRIEKISLLWKLNREYSLMFSSGDGKYILRKAGTGTDFFS